MQSVFSTLIHNVMLCLVVLTLSASSATAQFLDGSDKVRQADYIFVCSSFGGLDASLVSSFYAEVFDDDTPVIVDGVPITTIEPAKSYVLMSFGTKPLSHYNFACLRQFSALEDDWLDRIGEQDAKVGTMPEELKDLAFSAYAEPVTSITSRFSSEKAYLVSYISTHEGEELRCDALTLAFGVRDASLVEYSSCSGQ